MINTEIKNFKNVTGPFTNVTALFKTQQARNFCQLTRAPGMPKSTQCTKEDIITQYTHALFLHGLR